MHAHTSETEELEGQHREEELQSNSNDILVEDGGDEDWRESGNLPIH